MFTKLDKKQYRYICTIAEIRNSNIIRPDIQRLIDYKRVQSIFEYQREYYFKNNTFLLIGDIVLGEVDKQFYILDGMHRLEAMKYLLDIMPDYNVSCTIIKCANVDEVRDIFLLINKSIPVPEYVIKTSFDKTTKEKLDEFLFEFRNVYKPYISESKAPHKPNINIDFLMAKLEQSTLVDYFESGNMLFKFFMYLNDTFLKQVIRDHNSIKCEEKAKKYCCKPLFITNDPGFNWLHNDIYRQAFNSMNYNEPKEDSLFNQERFINITNTLKCDWQDEFNNLKNIDMDIDKNIDMDMDTPILSDTDDNTQHIYRKKTIPKAIRGQVWRTYFKRLDTDCPLCDNIISIDNFECGHIKSRKYGGEDSVNNLIPICGKCNKSMSSTNFYDYCNNHNIKIKYLPETIYTT